MKRLGLIETLGGWGGSEVLWTEVAARACQQGVEVVASVSPEFAATPVAANLAKAGVELCLRLQSRRPNGMVPRVINAAKRRLLPEDAREKSLVHWRTAFAKLPDAILVSQGGAFCSLMLAGLVDWLEQARVRHLVVCQSARSQFPVNDALRERVVRYYGNAHQVLFPSAETAAEVQLMLAQSLPNAAVFQNPVEVPPGAPPRWPESDAPLLSCPARFQVADKGQDLLFQTLAQPKWQHRRFKLRMFGKGPDEHYLRRLTDYFGIGGAVEFAGQTAGTQPIWEQSQLVVLPSRSEGLSLVLLGAMAAARPTVVTAVGGHGSWVREGCDGFVADSPSVASFDGALERAWQARPRWREIGLCARERFLRHYDRDPVATMLTALSETAAGRRYAFHPLPTTEQAPTQSDK